MPDESYVEPVIGARIDALDGNRPVDAVIARLAERQHGVVARAQLVGLGLGRRAIGHRLEQGRLHVVHRGVYAVGHAVLSIHSRWMAAVLAGGKAAALSHRSAADLWGVRSSTRVQVDVTVDRSRRRRRGVDFHRAPLPTDEVTVAEAIPVTTVPRTLLDLATVLDRRQVERALNQAEVRRLADPVSLGDLLMRHPRRRGAATIRAILDAGRIGADVTRSELEERFLAFVDVVGLPRPEVNVSLPVRGGWVEADCVWRRQRVVVELDGHAAHATATAYERDRARDRALHAAGWRVVRVTWRQLHDDARSLAADLLALLGPATGT